MSGPLFAEENQKQSEAERVLVGEHAMSYIERAKIQEKRALLADKVTKGVPLSDEELANLTEAEQEDLAFNEGKEKIPCQKPDRENRQASKNRGVPKHEFRTYTPTHEHKFRTYTSTHDGAFHFPVVVSPFGDTVEFEDGSIWSVSFSDRRKTLNWMSGDTVIVTPNENEPMLSTEDFCLVNLNTYVTVKANLCLGPLCCGCYTYYIVGIDYVHREVYLNDGSVWQVSFWDNSILDTWCFDHAVIIGINDGYLSHSNPNILINVNRMNYVIGSSIY